MKGERSDASVENRPYRVRLKFWPGCVSAGLGRPAKPGMLVHSQFDVEFDIVAPSATAAAAAALQRGAVLLRGKLPEFAPSATSAASHHEHDAYLPELDLSTTPAASPLSLWRAQDGWILVFTGRDDAWRTFCATFLNRDAARSIPAKEAWQEPIANTLATQVLDTHKADDAVGTCLTYGVPAVVVAGWRDVEAPAVSKALSEHLAWAAIEQLAPPKT